MARPIHLKDYEEMSHITSLRRKLIYLISELKEASPKLTQEDVKYYQNIMPRLMAVKLIMDTWYNEQRSIIERCQTLERIKR